MNTMVFGYVAVSLMLLSCLWALSGLRRGARVGGQRSVWGGLRDLPFLIVGASPVWMRRCPLSDQVGYATLGWAMLMIAWLAAMGMGLSVYQFKENVPIAIFVAVFWGLLIIAIDRLMVVSIDKHEPAWKSWLKALPRLVMIIALSLVVSHTIIQWMFASDIRRELLKMNQETSDVLNRDDRLRQAEIKRRVAELNEQLKPVDTEISGLNVKLPKEVAGEGDSSKRGDGPVASALREALRQAQARKDALLTERAQLETAVKEIDKQVAANNSTNQEVLNAPAGLLGRARAVERLIAQNPHARTLYWALILGLLLVESIPVMTKLLASRPTRYDGMVMEQYERQAIVRTLRQRIYALFAQGNLRASDYDSDLVKDFWNEIERELRAGLTITQEVSAVANKESTLKVYVAAPGTQTEKQRLFVNFGLPKSDVLPAHLIKALSITAESNDPAHSHWLTQGQFRVLDAQGKAVDPQQPLFAQLPDGVAFVVPVKSL